MQKMQINCGYFFEIFYVVSDIFGTSREISIQECRMQ